LPFVVMDKLRRSFDAPKHDDVTGVAVHDRQGRIRREVAANARRGQRARE
jgi:hypothetical protein